MLCDVRTSNLAHFQCLNLLLILSQNVNWITTTQINPRHEKTQTSFYISSIYEIILCSLKRSVFLFCRRFFIYIFIFFYLYIFILEMLGKLLPDVQNEAKFECSFWSFFAIYLCPTTSLIKQGQELKQDNWKYWRNLTWTRPVNKTLADFLNAPFASWLVFYSEGQSLFPHGQDKDSDSFKWLPV